MESAPAAVTPLRRVTAAYLSLYSRLPPGIQLVGLQLLLPAFFIVMFCFCYIAAFSAPTVDHAPVAVIGSEQVASELQDEADGTLFSDRLRLSGQWY